MYIAFEGIDGSGKTTAIKLVSEWLNKNGYDNIAVREPEGVMRELIKGTFHKKYGQFFKRDQDIEKIPKFQKWSIIYSHVISHVEQYTNVIIPALDSNKIVLTDRNAYTSMIPYQVGGNGFVRRQIEEILRPVTFPDAVLFFDITPEELKTYRKESKKDDQFDTADKFFRDRVYAEYQAAYRADKKATWHRVDARMNIDNVVERCIVTIRGIVEDRTNLADGSEDGFLRDYDKFNDARKVQV